MNTALIGEEVTLCSPCREQLVDLLVGAAEAFLEAAGMGTPDRNELRQRLRAGMGQVPGDAAPVCARIVLVADGIEIRLGLESEGSVVRTITCRC